MHAWIFSLLVSVSPPGHNPARETEAAALVRYESIAEDVETVAREAPLFDGPHGAERTAALIVAIAAHESGLRVDVDLGLTRGGGLDSCLMQIRTAREDVRTDRRTCFRVGVRLVRRSLNACRTAPMRDRLAAYASGSCWLGLGVHRSHEMMDPWFRLLAAHPYEKRSATTNPVALPPS